MYILVQVVSVCGKSLCNLRCKLLPRDASAERGDATVSRPSVRPSVTIGYRVQMGLNSSKIAR